MSAGCTEKFGNKVESTVGGAYAKLGHYVGFNPRKTIAFAILLTAITSSGFMRWKTENRQEKLWVPQNTKAEVETEQYETHFESLSRLNVVIVKADKEKGNVLTKDRLVDAMKMHAQIAAGVATVDEEDHTFTSLCTPAKGVCASSTEGVCGCLIQSALKLWDYDLEQLENDTDVLATLNAGYTNRAEMEAVFGGPAFDESTNELLSAEAFTISYFIKDGTKENGSDEAGTEADPKSEAWEGDVFINATNAVADGSFPSLSVDFLAGRSFSDEFGGAITGDLFLVQISYAVVFIFLALTMGKVYGPGSRQTLSLGALIMVVLSTGACYGVSSGLGLFFGPVHSLLPFILLGIGVDDAFVILNAFNRERKVPRNSESNDDIGKRCEKAMKRAGASILVTSVTDMVAFGISSSSSLPALASFCAYAAVGIVFLLLFASTFFAAVLVLDERRQRDNRRECLCCLTRGPENAEEQDNKYEEGRIATYFRNIHSPFILSKIGKAVTLLVFSCTLGFGIYGAINLSVENTERSFIPPGSYLTDFLRSIDTFYPSSGVDVFIVFEDGGEIYEKREFLSTLDDRLAGLSTKAPYISEPTTEGAYKNIMAGLSTYLQNNSFTTGVTLGSDGWPMSEEDFTAVMNEYLTSRDGFKYFRDIKFSDDGSEVLAIRVTTQLVSLTKKKMNGNIIDDADKQIEAMDAYRNLVESWGENVPKSTFLYSARFIAVEGFKIIKQELYTNVGLALAAVALIVLITVASPMTAGLITLNVAACIVEILGAMYYIGIAIDSVSVINIVLAVGLSIDYSAHVGHCFMMKGGDNRDRRALEALADIGSAVLSGALSTFLAVVVLLFSSSYVFKILSQQFALTVGLGVLHGLVLLPVLLSLLGPKAFEAAEMPVGKSKVCKELSSEDESELGLSQV